MRPASLERPHSSAAHPRRVGLLSAALLALVLASCSGCEPDQPVVGPLAAPLLDHTWGSRVGAQGFALSRDGKTFKPFWPVGASWTATLPGNFPAKQLATRAQLDRWLATMAEMGGNTVRLHGIAPPSFYQALRNWNLWHQDKPIFLLQGVWLIGPEDDETLAKDYLQPPIIAGFSAEVERAVDVVHGRYPTPPGGKAEPGVAGDDADVSPWLLGFVIGRELDPDIVAATHALHPEPSQQRFVAGKYLRIENVLPMTAFWVSQMDHAIDYEQRTYGAQHPVGMANSPALDPLVHPTEPPPPQPSLDRDGLDLSTLTILPAATAGVFLGYAAYPWGPDFAMYQPEYAAVSDQDGPNPLQGYLQALRDHDPKLGIVLLETGVPSSLGCGHYAPSGLNQGGLSEVEQGWAQLRLLRTAVQAGMHGAFLAAMTDEWFRRDWIRARLTLPADDRPLWFDALNPSSSYGLIAFKPTAHERVHVLDGRLDDWQGLTPQAARTGANLVPTADGLDPMRAIHSITLDSDAGYLHILLRVDNLDPDGDGKVQWDKVDYVVALDTVDNNAGDSALDPARAVQCERRVEFQVRIDAADRVELRVDRPYDLFGLPQGLREAWQQWKSVANDDGNFHLVRVLTNDAYRWSHSLAGAVTPTVTTLGPAMLQELGALPTGPEAEQSNTAMAYDIATGSIELRLAWGLLQFVDPAQGLVVDGAAPDGQQVSARQVGEIAVAVASYAGVAEDEAAVADTLPAAQPATDRAGKPGAWRIPAAGMAVWPLPRWTTAPPVVERRKKGFLVLRDHLRAILPASASLSP